MRGTEESKGTSDDDNVGYWADVKTNNQGSTIMHMGSGMPHFVRLGNASNGILEPDWLKGRRCEFRVTEALVRTSAVVSLPPVVFPGIPNASSQQLVQESKQGQTYMVGNINCSADEFEIISTSSHGTCKHQTKPV